MAFTSAGGIQIITLQEGGRALRHVLTPDKLRDAVRLGAQSAVAAVATLVLLALAGVEQHFLGVISAVLVLDPSRDATIGNALQRIVATVIGTVVGAAGLLLGPQGQIASMALVVLLMGAIAAVRPQWRYGLVAAVGVAISPETQVWASALDRIAAIFIGAGTGISAGLLIWPKSSRGFALRHLREAFATCNRLLRHTIDSAVSGFDEDLSELHQNFVRQVERASGAAGSMRLTHARQKRLLTDAIHRAERIWHALIILDRVGETKSRSTIVADRQSREVERIKEQCCAALACLERLEPVPEDCLEAIDRSGEALDLLHSAKRDPDRVELLGLTYGLHEVIRNIHEASNAVRDLERG